MALLLKEINCSDNFHPARFYFSGRLQKCQLPPSFNVTPDLTNRILVNSGRVYIDSNSKCWLKMIYPWRPQNIAIMVILPITSPDICKGYKNRPSFTISKSSHFSQNIHLGTIIEVMETSNY